MNDFIVCSITGIQLRVHHSVTLRTRVRYLREPLCVKYGPSVYIVELVSHTI